MADKQYEIFISYRRDGGAQYARILQLMLIQRGYRVFLDYDELKDGVFNDRIVKSIKEAPIFIIVLSKGSLLRCLNEGDSVRNEIELAVSEKKQIIPVNPDKTFDGIPQGLPPTVAHAVGDFQQSEINFGQALGVLVDYMIANRIADVIGNREKKEKVDEDYDAALETLRKIDRHQKYMRGVAAIGLVVVIAIVLATCFIIKKKHDQRQALTSEWYALAVYLWRSEDYDGALSAADTCVAVANDYYGPLHEETKDAYLLRGDMNANRGNKELAFNNLEHYFSIAQEKTQLNFVHLTNTERSNYWRQFREEMQKMAFYAYEFKDFESEYTDVLFNVQLYAKGLLLTIESAFLKVINNNAENLFN